MDYKVRKAKAYAEMIDALRIVSAHWSKVYYALKKVYSDDDVSKLMNGGLKGEPGGYEKASAALQAEVIELVNAVGRANLGDEEKKD